MNECYYCGLPERARFTRIVIGPRLRSSMTYFGFGPVAMCRHCITYRVGTAA